MAKHMDVQKVRGVNVLFAVVLGLLCGFSARAALYLSDPLIVSPPALTTNKQIRFGPRFAAGSKTTLFGWGELNRVPGSLTNTLVVAIGPTGNMLDPGGHVVAAAQYAGQVADLIPAGEDFFAVYARKSLQTSNTNEWVFTVADAEGAVVTGPISFAKNVVVRSSASNGDTLLNTWMVSVITLPGINYALHNRSGVELKAANIPFAVPQNSGARLLAASAAGNYLILLSYNGVNAAVIDGAGGYVTSVLTTNRLTIDALRSNGSEYLLIAHTTDSSTPETKFYQLNARGVITAEAAIPRTAQVLPPTIIPDGNDWLVFEQRTYGFFENYTVHSAGESLTIEPGPFPAIEGVAIERFRSDQLIVGSVKGSNVSYRLMTVDHSSPEQTPAARISQSHTAVGTSPAGYLVAWQETGVTTNILAMRFRRDGTRVDPEPLQIARERVNDVIRINYEQSHYKLAWQEYNSGNLTHVHSALVDAEGPPNVRTNKITPLSGWVSASMLEITPYRDTSILFQRQDNLTLQDYEAGPAQLGIIQPRMTFAGRGEELLKVMQDGLGIIAGRSPSVFGELTETNDFGVGTLPNAIAMTNSFLVTWRNTAGALASALLEDGSVLLTNVLLAPSQLGADFSLAASTNKALVSATAPAFDLRNTNTFVLVDGASGATATLERTILYGTNRIVSLAPLGKDFIVGSSLWDGTTTYAAIQVLSEAPPPSLSIAQMTQGEVTIPISVSDPQRTYVVQQSSDLVSWETVKTYNGSSTYVFTSPPQGMQMFYRVVALPD